MLSKENKERIKRGENPIFDEEWIKAFPRDKPFLGEEIPLIGHQERILEEQENSDEQKEKST